MSEKIERYCSCPNWNSCGYSSGGVSTTGYVYCKLIDYCIYQLPSFTNNTRVDTFFSPNTIKDIKWEA